MKKLLVIGILLLYGASSLGVTFQLHFCCGKFKNIEWSPVQNDDCSSEHKMGDKPCCVYKAISFQEDENYTGSRFVILPAYASAAVIPASFHHIFSSSFTTKISQVLSPAIQLYEPPLFLLHHVFRI